MVPGIILLKKKTNQRVGHRILAYCMFWYFYFKWKDSISLFPKPSLLYIISLRLFKTFTHYCTYICHTINCMKYLSGFSNQSCQCFICYFRFLRNRSEVLLFHSHISVSVIQMYLTDGTRNCVQVCASLCMCVKAYRSCPLSINE